jgi:hypothetical protein
MKRILLVPFTVILLTTGAWSQVSGIDRKTFTEKEIDVKPRLIKKPRTQLHREGSTKRNHGHCCSQGGPLGYWKSHQHPSYFRSPEWTDWEGHLRCQEDQIYSSDEGWKVRFDMDAARIYFQSHYMTGLQNLQDCSFPVRIL